MNKHIMLLGFMVAIFVGCGLSTSTVVKKDEAARSRIVSSGVKLPPSATKFPPGSSGGLSDFGQDRSQTAGELPIRKFCHPGILTSLSTLPIASNLYYL